MRARLVALIVLIGLALAGTTVPASAAAGFTVTPTSLAFGNVTVNSTLTKSVVIKNSGTFNLQIKADLGAGRFALANVTTGNGSCLTGPTTGLNLGVGQTCTLSVAFTPTATSAVSGSVALYGLPATGAPGTSTTYADGSTIGVIKNLPLSGTGVTMTATVSPASLAFGNVDLGAVKYLKATVTNTSTVPVTVAPSFNGMADFTSAPYVPVVSDACVRQSGETRTYQVVPPNSTCDVEVHFRPAALGARSGTITLSIGRVAAGVTGETNDPAVPERFKTIALTGTGINPPFTLTPTSLAFGSVTQGGVKYLFFTVKNTSNNPLQFWPDPSSAGGFTPTPGDCAQQHPSGIEFPLTIAPAASCQMVVIYHPDGVGADKANLAVGAYTPAPPTVSGAPGGTRLTTKVLPVSGAGIAPTLTTTPTSLSFGPAVVTSTKYLPVTVTNTSGTPVQYWPRLVNAQSNFEIFEGDGSAGAPACAQSVIGGTQHTMVAPGASCSFLVAFHPKLVGQVSAQVLVETYAGGSGSTPVGPVLATKSIAASGTGTAPTLTAQPTSVAFGNVTVGGQKSMPVVLTNTSSVGVQYWPGASTPAYSLSMGSCFDLRPTGYVVATIAPGASCTVDVAFVPTATGYKAGSVAVDVYVGVPGIGPDGPRQATKVINVSGTGVAPTMAVSPTAIAFGAWTTNTSTSRTVTVTNTSQFSLQFGAEAPDGSPVTVSPLGGDNGCFEVEFGVQRPQTIQPGQTCTMTVGYSPTSVGLHTADVVVNGHGPGNGVTVQGPVLTSATIKVSGSGKALSSTATPTSLGFGYVQAGRGTKTLTVTLRNTSTVAVRYTPAGPSESPFQLSGTSANGVECAPTTMFGRRHLVVAPGAQCTVTVTFAPWRTGSQSGALLIGIHRTLDAAGTYGPTPAGTPETTLTVNMTGSG